MHRNGITANSITGLRIVFSIAILFCPVFSPLLYVFYLIAGISDMIDGPIARMTGTVSRFGERFDSIADLIFVIVCLIKLLPALALPIWLYSWIAVIALIRAVNIVYGYVTQKRFVTLHTVMNKVTGALLFLLPLTVTFVDVRYSAAVVCAVATFAAVQESRIIWKTNHTGEKAA